MGLFTKSAPVVVNEALRSKLLGYGDDRDQKAMDKALGANQDAILAELQSGEVLVTVCVHFNIAAHVFVITNRRVIDFAKGKVDRQILREDLARVDLSHLNNGHVGLSIYSREAMDYPESDPRKFIPRRYIVVETDTSNMQFLKDLGLVVRSAVP